MPAHLAERIDALLPQTQCQRCGYPACRPYAEAIADGSAEINQCPPGGDEGIASLAALLDRTTLPMNPANGAPIVQASVAVIDEAVCIGCTKCIQACPTDAILGAANLMHTVIADECSGCELCVPPCPVDCIVIVPARANPRPMSKAPQYRRRYLARSARLQRWQDEKDAEHARRKASLVSSGDVASDPVARALAAARQKNIAP